MKAPATELWQAVRDAFGDLRGQRTRSRWLDEARPLSLSRGLLTLAVGDEVAKVVVDSRYAQDLETLLLELTGSRVRVHVRVVEKGSREREVPRRVPLPPKVRTHASPPSFVVTESNKLAFRAACDFVETSQPHHQVLFVHGCEGAGKTVLARHVLELWGNSESPLVLSGEAMAVDIGRAVRGGDMMALREAWSGHRAVILDEAHRLRGRRRCQQEAARIISDVHAVGGKVVIFSRHVPRDIHLLDGRLESYFLSGMTVGMDTPSLSDRQAILSAVAQALPVQVDGDVPVQMANRCPGPLTESARILQRMAVKVGDSTGRITLEQVTPWLTRPGGKTSAMDELLRILSKQTKISTERIRSSEKTRSVARTRHVCIYIATRSLGFSARQTCRYLRLRSPSAVAYARRQVERLRATDRVFDSFVRDLQGRIEGAQRDLPW